MEDIVVFVEGEQGPRGLDKNVFYTYEQTGERRKGMNVPSGESGDVRNTGGGSQTWGGGPEPPTVSL